MRIVRFRGYGGQVQSPSVPKRINLKYAGRQNRTFVIQSFNYTSVKRRADEYEDEKTDPDGYYEYDDCDQESWGKDVSDIDVELDRKKEARSDLSTQQLRMKRVNFNARGTTDRGPTLVVDINRNNSEGKKSINKSKKEIYHQMSLLQANKKMGSPRKSTFGKQGIIYQMKPNNGITFAVQTPNSKIAYKKSGKEGAPKQNSKYSFRVKLNER